MSSPPLLRAVLGRTLLAGALVADAGSGVARLKPETEQAWKVYVTATEQRRAGEVADRERFLAADFARGGSATRESVRAGGVATTSVETRLPNGRSIDTPDGLIHHWRGAVFIPGATVSQVMARLANGPPRQADVLQSRVLAEGPGWMRVFLRLSRSKVITVVYDTEHDVRFTRYGPGRGASTTIATRIVEVDNPGTSTERQRAPGDDHGFLWRLNAYWRYLDVPGGVIAECESLSLSRGIPFGLGTFLGPLVASTAREAMESALLAVRDSVTQTRLASSPVR